MTKLNDIDMKNLTREYIESQGCKVIYHYIRGSQCQGTAIPGVSDIDEGGVYVMPVSSLLGLGFDYKSEISNDSHDQTWYELNTFIALLLKSNPTALEALFVDDEFVLYEDKLMTQIKKIKNTFITKKCFQPIFGYAVSQISKAQGYNKMCVQDESKMKRKSPYEFCYTTYNQGTTHIMNWLRYRGLYPEFCGLNRLPHTDNMFGVFYDFGAHKNFVGYSIDDAIKYYEKTIEDGTLESKRVSDIDSEHCDDYKYCYGRYCIDINPGHTTIKEDTILNYRGIFMTSRLNDEVENTEFKDVDEEIEYYKKCHKNESTQVRLSSIDDKDDKPICFMWYKMDDFSRHCTEYHNYLTWKKHRNVQRYNDNKGYNYDAKNMAHAFRLCHMGIEIANGKGFNVKRTWDVELLREIRNHKYDYDTLIKNLESLKGEFNDAIAHSTIPDDIDKNIVNKMLIKVRTRQFICELLKKIIFWKK